LRMMPEQQWSACCWRSEAGASSRPRRPDHETKRRRSELQYARRTSRRKSPQGDGLFAAQAQCNQGHAATPSSDEVARSRSPRSRPARSAHVFTARHSTRRSRPYGPSRDFTRWIARRMPRRTEPVGECDLGAALCWTGKLDGRPWNHGTGKLSADHPASEASMSTGAAGIGRFCRSRRRTLNFLSSIWIELKN
jgi:hypothetical protein